MLYKLLRPLLFRLEAERAHELVCAILRVAGGRPLIRHALALAYRYDHPALKTLVAGMDLPNPLGLAAGFDKQGLLYGPMASFGFGHVEVGTITPRPQAGNPPPRLFRLAEDQALINRMGFNNPGMRVLARRLRGPRPLGVHVGVNIGKNRDTPLERAAEDYLAAFVALAPLADYVAVNVSSPNTPGLRLLQQRRPLEELLRALAAANRTLQKPIFVKISPDEPPETLEMIATSTLRARLHGIIATNTTVSRPPLQADGAQAGGLSGAPLKPLALEALQRVFRATAGRLPIIAAGGISTAADAYARITAGAFLVQLYTALIYQGPTLSAQINRGLVRLMIRDGFASVLEAVGTAELV